MPWVTPGQRADPVLLNSDPFVNITNTQDIARIWIAGIDYTNIANKI